MLEAVRHVSILVLENGLVCSLPPWGQASCYFPPNSLPQYLTPISPKHRIPIRGIPCPFRSPRIRVNPFDLAVAFFYSNGDGGRENA